MVKNPLANAGDRCKRSEFNPWVRKISWRRAWQSTPVFLPAELHGQRSLVGYSPWGCRQLDTTEQLTHTSDTTTSFIFSNNTMEVKEEKKDTIHQKGKGKRIYSKFIPRHIVHSHRPGFLRIQNPRTGSLGLNLGLSLIRSLKTCLWFRI